MRVRVSLCTFYALSQQLLFSFLFLCLFFSSEPSLIRANSPGNSPYRTRLSHLSLSLSLSLCTAKVAYDQAMEEKRRRQQAVEAERRAALAEQEAEEKERANEERNEAAENGELPGAHGSALSSSSREKEAFLHDMLSLVVLLVRSKAGLHYLSSAAVTQTLLMFFSAVRCPRLRQTAIEVLGRTVSVSQPSVLRVTMELYFLQLGEKVWCLSL
jgi:hypothetical protein